MKDSKIIILLKALTPDEFRQFEKFTESSYFNMGRDLTPFLSILKTFYPEFESKDLNSRYVFDKLFPGKKYEKVKSDNLIRTFSSHLFRICKEFLVLIELESQKSKKKFLLLNQLRKKGIYKEFDKEFENVIQDSESEVKGSVGYFVDEYLLSSVKRDCSLNRDDFKNSFEYTLKASEKIITAALISGYKFEDEKNLAKAYNFEVRGNIIQSLLDNLNSENLLSEIGKNGNDYHLYIQIFLGIYMMNRFSGKNEYYYTLKDLLKAHSGIFGQSENYVLWNIMLTYCGVNKLGSNESFQLYKYMLENNIYKLSSKEKFHIVLFRNIVLESSSIGEYKWLEYFIEKYSGELHENHRENMKSYSMSYLYFSRSEFEKALEHILKVKYNLFLFKMDLRILQSKIYYELGYYEEGLSLISAILSYLSDTKEFADYIKKSIGNFVKCLRELIKFRTGVKFSDENIFEMKNITKEIFHISLSVWLGEKITELEKKNY